VVDDEDHRAPERDLVCSFDLDAPKEEAQDEPEKWPKHRRQSGYPKPSR